MNSLPDLFWEIHTELPREGPGDNASTQRAFAMMTGLPEQARILDIGCGPGMQTLALAEVCKGPITAVDTHLPFLKELERRAAAAGVAERVTALQASMFELPFAEHSFEVLWCEGAMYFLGFEKALQQWQRLLTPGGYMAVTEPCWLKADPPAEVRAHWAEYPEMSDIATRQAQIQALGYHEIGHFVLPQSAWWDDYYTPQAARIQMLKQKYADQPEALLQLTEAEKELTVHQQYSDYYGYVFFVIQLGGQAQSQSAKSPRSFTSEPFV